MHGTSSTVGRATLRAFRSTALTVAVVAACAVSAALLNSPRAIKIANDSEQPPKAAPVRGQNAFVVTLDADGQQKGGVETASPQAMPYQNRVRAYGTVLVLDRLTSLYNQAIGAAAQLQGAKVRLAAAKVANDRAKNLLKVFSTAQVQAEAADAAFKIDGAAVDAAQAQMDILRNTAVQDWGATLGGAIVSRGTLAEDLVLRRRVLVQLTLKPGTFVMPPARIELTFAELPSVEADLVSESTQVDPKIQNIGFWYTAPSSVGLVAGTAVLAFLPKGETKPGVGIPPSAVVWQAGKAWMFVREGSDRFERRAIDDGAAPLADGGFVVPASSLPVDEKLVVAGAQTLLSEEARAQLPAQEDDN